MRRLCAGKAFSGAPELSPDAGAAASTSFLGTADEAEGGTLRGIGGPKMGATGSTWDQRGVLNAVAALSLVAALIHLWVMPEHFEEWWGYGAFFLVCAVAQVVYVPLLLRRPDRTVLLLGVAGNSAIVLLYLLTRVVGIPVFGPEAGEVEGVGAIDLCATTSEAAMVVALGALVLMGMARNRTTMVGVVLSAVLLVAAHLPHVLLVLVALL